MSNAQEQVVELDPDRCTDCTDCVVYCSYGVLTYVNGGINLDQDKCNGCGECIDKCTINALSLVPYSTYDSGE